MDEVVVKGLPANKVVGGCCEEFSVFRSQGSVLEKVATQGSVESALVWGPFVEDTEEMKFSKIFHRLNEVKIIKV